MFRFGCSTEKRDIQMIGSSYEIHFSFFSISYCTFMVNLHRLAQVR